MKTEEAYRALSQAKELAQEWEELSETAGMDAFCPISAGNGGAFWIILVRQIHLCFR